MRAASENSMKAGLKVLLEVMHRDDIDAMEIAENLFGLSDLARKSNSVRHNLTDPGRSAEDKRQLAENLLSGGVEPQTIEVVKALVTGSWSAPQDIGEALEVLGNEAVFSAAERNNKLAEVEKQLFAVNGFLGEHRDLRIGLSDLGVGTAHDRAHFAADLFGDAINVYTKRLVRRAVRLSVHGRLQGRIRNLTVEAAQRQGELFAHVTSAQPLQDQQLQRLKELLEKRYNAAITLNASVDPDLIGGLHVKVDDQAINASIKSNLVQARREIQR